MTHARLTTSPDVEYDVVQFTGDAEFVLVDVLRRHRRVRLMDRALAPR